MLVYQRVIPIAKVSHPSMCLQVALGSRWVWRVWALAASRTTRLGGSAVCTVHVLLHL